MSTELHKSLDYTNTARDPSKESKSTEVRTNSPYSATQFSFGVVHIY